MKKLFVVLVSALACQSALASDKVAFVRCEQRASQPASLTFETLDLNRQGEPNYIVFPAPDMDSCRANLAQFETRVNGLHVTRNSLVGVCFYNNGASDQGWMLARLLVTPDSELSYSAINTAGLEDCLKMATVINDKIQL